MLFDATRILDMQLKCILFDMGNVLVRFSHDLMCEQMAKVGEVSPDDVRKLLLDDGLQWKFERGELSEQQFHSAFCEAVNKQVSFPDLRTAAAEIFWADPGILPILESLKSRGIKMVLLSNTSVWHFNYLKERFGFLDYFSDFAVSFKAGSLKPDRAIYQQAISLAGCLAGECFFVDDRDENVVAARELGIQAELFTTAQQLPKQLAKFGL